MVADELLDQLGTVHAHHRRVDSETLRCLDGEMDSRLHLIAALPPSRFGG
jgi:hypothetical protein